MAIHQTAFVAVHVVAAVGILAVAAVAARHDDTPGAKPLAVLSVTIAFWTLANGAILTRSDPASRRLLADLAHLGVVLVPVALLYFAVEYTNHEVSLTRYGPGPLLAVPAITTALIWTNPAHELMWQNRGTADMWVAAGQRSFGPWFWVHAGYSYLLIAVASYLLLRMLVVSEDVYRGQAAALVVGIAIPWLANAVHLAGLSPFAFDPTPIGFGLSAVAFLFAIYREHLLELTPVARELARDELMDSLAEAVFILNDDRVVVDCNERAREIVGDSAVDPVGSTLSATLPELAAAVETAVDAASNGDHETETAFRQRGRLRHYDLHVTELRRGGGLLSGHLVSLRDVTDRRQREQRLDVLNRALRHDLRNDANVILGYAELGMENNPDADWVRAIQEHVSDMVELSAKVRDLEEALGEGETETRRIDIVAVVERVVDQVETERPDLDVETELPDSARVEAVEFVDTAVENAVENAVEHNDNPDPLIEAAVTVRTTDRDTVEVEIADNGPGIHEDERAVLLRGRETQLDHVSGLGLWIINWIVTESGGEIRFSENEPRGSIVTLELPGADPDSTATEQESQQSRPTAATGNRWPANDGEL
jgi:PAS domain S-box-containing protein